jgi:hypothetical protein
VNEPFQCSALFIHTTGIRVLHNDSAVSRRYTESNEKPMLPWIICSDHKKNYHLKENKKNSKSDWK